MHVFGGERVKAYTSLKYFSFILFNDLQRFHGGIETDSLTVSNSEIITFDFTVSKKNRIFVKQFHLVVD